jgi:polyhydroxyalkanoate synthase
VALPDALVDAAANGFDLLIGDGPADLTRQPSSIIDEGPQRTIHRYRPRPGTRIRRGPVLLVPPLAAPASCFDLRRGCSLAEHLIGLGYRTYLVDYGPIGFSDRALGLEHWVEGVLPQTVRRVSEDAGGVPVQPIGWSLGGIMLPILAASDPDLPLASLSLIGSPFDFHRSPPSGGSPRSPGAGSSPPSTGPSAARRRRSSRSAFASRRSTAT